ncbi:MAG: SpoIIE family protein phosphatase [Gammaproteobacteria bacterium]|nr:SpoIIE family protein phosphatase [Gammaproteobacteria bacterium]
MSDRLAFLRETELLSGLPEALLAEVDRCLREVTLGAGEVLFEQDAEGDAVYLVCEGVLRVEVDGVTLMQRARGDCIGELALLDDEPRSAAAVADTDVQLLRWERRDFQRILGHNPHVARGIFKMLTGKLREDVKSTVSLAREKERWRQDLARAREIQQGMLPAGLFVHQHLELAGVCSPASEVGGDFYDYICPRSDAVGLIVGDVTGHGFYAGLFVAMAKSALHIQARFDFGPAEVMQAMRRTLDLSIQRRLLMSCAYVLFDTAAGRVRYANAGHPYPYVYRARDRLLTRLEALDPILGALEIGGGEYAERSLAWGHGDVLVMYTDGITEARDGQGRMFDHHSLEACIAEHAGESAVTIKEQILRALKLHSAVGPGDDLTLVVVKAR